VLAIVTERGTRSSHTAILARALEIPAVVGAGEVLGRIAHGDRIVVDGLHGRVTINPSPVALEEAERRARRYREMAQGLRQLKDRPATTRCGTRIVLKANIELEGEAAIALEQGAEGVGLYRTEFLYLNRASQPGEEEQYQTYRRVVEALAPLPVTMRTFDLGGDKLAFALPIPPGHNPALGFRAVRLGLELPELMLTQLRAMVRASAHGNLQIMIPMVASLTELFRVRQLLEQAIAEIDARAQARAERVELGTMIEVPSAAILADHFATHSDFMSIGTNDLVQYTLAVDRTSRELARLASDLDPAVLQLLKGVIQAGKLKGRPVVVCGAMASDPLSAVVLVGMGLRELSLEASSLPEVKEALSRVTLEEAEDVARLGLAAQTADEVETLVAERFAPRLADLLEP
jgi:phosphotransferase system enzyme I (PtsI)